MVNSSKYPFCILLNISNYQLGESAQTWQKSCLQDHTEYLKKQNFIEKITVPIFLEEVLLTEVMQKPQYNTEEKENLSILNKTKIRKLMTK